MKKAIILLVDDNRHLRVTLGDHLSHQGYEVMAAESGEEALAMIRDRSPDLVILDINMPGMGGVGFLRHIVNKADGRPKYPVLVLTARSSMESFFDTVPVDGFLPKPCPVATLMAKIEEVFAKRGIRIQPAPESATPDPARGIILLAEDDPLVADQIVKLFSDSGFTVEVAGEGAAVMEQAAVLKPGLIMLKQLLPQMNGNVVGPMLAKMPSLRGTPIVLYDESRKFDDPAVFQSRIPKCVTRYIASNKAHDLLRLAHEILGVPRPDGRLPVLAMLPLVLALAAGCETAGDGPGNLRLSPSVVTVTEGDAQSVLFSVEGGYTPYAWSVSDTNLGELASSGDTAIYTAGAVSGENTVTVTDAGHDTASATVTRL